MSAVVEAIVTVPAAARARAHLDEPWPDVATRPVDGDGVRQLPDGVGDQLVAGQSPRSLVVGVRSSPPVATAPGNARCTTCRVEFIAGEPSKMTVAEKSVLAAKGLSGVRLSCQIPCEGEMSVRAISRLAGSGRPNAGPPPDVNIQPPPEWI